MYIARSFVKKYKELSWKEKIALYKEFGNAVNPRSKARTILFVAFAISMMTALILIMVHWQSSLWMGVGYPKLLNIGWWLLLPSVCVVSYHMGQEIERNKGFYKWLEQEKDIKKK